MASSIILKFLIDAVVVDSFDDLTCLIVMAEFDEQASMNEMQRR